MKGSSSVFAAAMVLMTAASSARANWVVYSDGSQTSAFYAVAGRYQFAVYPPAETDENVTFGLSVLDGATLGAVITMQIDTGESLAPKPDRVAVHEGATAVHWQMPRPIIDRVRSASKLFVEVRGQGPAYSLEISLDGFSDVLDRAGRIATDPQAAAERGERPDVIAMASTKSGNLVDMLADRMDFPVFDEPPKVVKQVNPEYPQSARDKAEEGKVFLQVAVDKTGRVVETLVSQASVSPALQQSARDAAEQWLFAPATHDGEPVNCVIVIPFEFRMQ